MLIHVSKLKGFGFAAFAAGVFVAPACSSAGDGGGQVTAGAAPVGGSNASGSSAVGAGTGGAGTGGVATAGTTAGGVSTGGVPTGGAGSGGVGGSSAGMSTAGSNTGGMPQFASTCKGIVPKAALISDFNDVSTPLWGAGIEDTDLGGGFFTYPTVPITFSTANDNLTASGSVATYSGFGLYVTYCGNASSYAGVRFKISGNAGESGSLVFHIQTNANKWADGGKGACLGPKASEFTNCVPPTTLITGITAQPKEVTILWTDVKDGKPVATTDGSDIIGFNWSFTWPAPAAYEASISIDDMEFVNEGAGAGGAGAGGAGAGGAP